jgi:predicted nucleic acid-binding protein
MNACVVDASVVAIAFFRERQAAKAQALLVADRPLFAPDLIWAELGNVIWKRHARGEIDDEEAAQLMTDFLRLPLQTTRTVELVETALQFAMHTGRTVYDSIYLALAVRTGSVLVTGDRRLANAMANGPFAEHVVSIDSFPAAS